MGAWETRPLKTFVDPNRSICYGIVQPGTPVVGGVPILRVNNFTGTGLNISNALYVSKAIERDYKRSRLQGGELLITLVGSLGLTAIASNEMRGWNVARAVGVIPLADDVDVRWINFMLRSGPARNFMAMRANTTVQATFNLKDLAELPIPMPPARLRRPMSELLSALDDKIELNQRMNETLEASTRALFRDWFVDFGPTRAKAEGRSAYLAPDLWSLFPDRLDDDGVPEGWSFRTLADLLEVSPREPLKAGSIAPYLDMAALPTKGASAQLPIDRVYSSGTRFRNGDTLLARITPCLENGKTAFVQNLPDGLVGWGSTEFIVLRAKAPIPKAVSYLIARHDEFRRHAIQSMTGTSGRQRADADAIAGYPAAVPVENGLWKALTAIINPIFEQIASNEQESGSLAATRDALLPKLMSGEIRVCDAEMMAA